MDTFLAIASRREVREFDDRAIPDDVAHRILDAGRLAGSSRNTQRWQFTIVGDTEALAGAVYAPDNVRHAPLVVAITGEAFPFDVGRAAQNMMLAAWNEGVGSVPNGTADAELAARVVGAEPVKMILSFGYAAKPRDPSSRTADDWSVRANRKPFDEIVRRSN